MPWNTVPKICHWKNVIRLGVVLLLSICCGAAALFVTMLNQTVSPATSSIQFAEPLPVPFPLGVDPETKQIVEQPNIQQYRTQYIATSPKQPERRNWFDNVANLFTNAAWLQQLALNNSRMLVIFAGERKEEIASEFADILNWDETEQSLFIETVIAANPQLPEGTFMPGKYLVPKDADPILVANMLTDAFARAVTDRYPEDIAAVVPLEEAVIIASLLEREAYDFTDMREISGIIWNRRFIEMPLQLDATLQYVRGSKTEESQWWPVPRSADKWLDSDFNTYQQPGLPPHAIANPSTDAILAALNPRATDCLFYLHANDGSFYCSETYAEHQKNISRYLR